MNIVNMSIDDVRPYDKNPRVNEKGIEAVANSIKEFGWQQPIVVDRDHVIIAGHTRYFAAKHLNLTEVPVVIAEHLTPEQVKSYRIADNKTGELSEWDFSLLSLELNDLQNANVDLNDLGFTTEELEEILAGDTGNTVSEGETDPESVPDAPDTAVSRLGEIYQLGKHRLMCGDSTSSEDVTRLMEGKKADMVYTDPPYGISYNGNPKGEEYQMIENDDLRGDSLTEFLRKVFQNLKTVLRERGAFYIWYAPSNHIQFEQAIIDAGLRSKQILIWHKGMILGRSNYHYAHEPCFYGCHADSNCDWYGDCCQATVWDVKRDNRHSPLHPNQKPPALAQIALFNSSKPNHIILDLFGGSGSTLIACEQTGRICRMMELDPKYCDVIRKRWAEFTAGEGCDWQALTPAINNGENENE